MPKRFLCLSFQSNGWDPNEMFKFNEENYGVKTTYDSSLSSYTSVTISFICVFGGKGEGDEIALLWRIDAARVLVRTP